MLYLHLDIFKLFLDQELLPVGVDDDESKEVKEEGDPVKAVNSGHDHETENNCNNRTKTDDHGVEDAEYLDKPGALSSETVQEDGGETNPKETENQANTEADDEYLEYVATHSFDLTRRFENLVNSIQDVFRRVAAVVRLPGL